MIHIKNRRGQFSIIAAFLVLVVLINAIILSYNRIQSNQFQEPVMLLSTAQVINQALKNLLSFSVGYYCQIFKVTGDYAYAQKATKEYFTGGLVKLAHSESNLNPSFNITSTSFKINWFKSESYSNGTMNLTYDIPDIGLNGVKYQQKVSLQANAIRTINNTLYINVYSDGKLDLSLTEDNFNFIKYDNIKKVWLSIKSEELKLSNDGTYIIKIPEEIDIYTYFLEVRNNLGIITRTIYIYDINGGGDNQENSFYKFAFEWDDNYYSQSNNDYFILEYLQNGTLRYLGQSLNIGKEKPIPQIPVRLLRLNQTIDSINYESRFQVEDWTSDFKVPLGLTNNNTIFNENNMIVFLVNHHVSDVTIWWVDNDDAKQTKKAWENVYFKDDPTHGILQSVDKNNNNLMKIGFSKWAPPQNYFETSYETTSVSSQFGLINSTSPLFPSLPVYIVYNGVIRDIVTQAAVVDTIDSSVPTIYNNYVITLPANCTYYTYQITNIMLSTEKNRKINNLCTISITIPNNVDKYIMKTLTGEVMEVDGPTVNSPYSSGDHRWIEYISGKTTYTGGGILMMNEMSERLYIFDAYVFPQYAGEIIIGDKIDLSPISHTPLEGYKQYSRVTWYGAVMLFDSTSKSDTIYYEDINGVYGLYAMVVHPPTIS